MSFAALAGVFGVIVVLEIPDKTMIATIVMSSRARSSMVFVGASLAFVAQMAIAALAGKLLDRIPMTPRESIETALFLAGAGFLLLVPEKREVDKGDREGNIEKKARPARQALTAFTVVFLAEFGDLTQIQAANLAARTHHALDVFAAASLALICVAALGSWIGQRLIRVVPISRVRQLGGLIFAGLGIYGVVQLATS